MAVLATALGCGSGVEERTGEQPTAIVSGEPSPSPDDDAVVLLRREDAMGEFLCGATLVAPNLVVTARHCVAFVTDGPFQCTVRGEPIAVADGGGVLGADVAADTIEVYAGEITGSTPVARGREIVSTLSLTSCLNDLAFVVLDRSLALPVASVRLGSKTAAGEAVWIVGHGIEQAGPSELDWPNRPRKKARQTIDAVGPDSTDDVTTLRARTVVTRGPSACKGDSGGPALSDKTGAVIGVYAFHGGSDDCKSSAVVHYFTHLSPFGSLARQAFDRAQAEPIVEKRARFGEACQEPSDCEDAVCVAADSGTLRCSRTCNSSDPCPSGYECRPPMKLDGPNVCAEVVAADAMACPACDAGPAPPPSQSPSSSGGCGVGQTRPRGGSVAALAIALASIAFIRRPRPWPPRPAPRNSGRSRTRTA